MNVVVVRRHKAGVLLNSVDIIERNRRYLPGGCASGARYIDPAIVFSQAEGGRIFDHAGKSYLDVNCAFGAILLGHKDLEFEDEIRRMTEGTDLIGLGTTELEGELAERLCQIIPSADAVAFCCSGTEATFHAIRVARAHTGRNLIVKFQGAYHGWHDYVANNTLSVSAPEGPRDFGSLGILTAARDATIVLPVNDVQCLEEVFQQHGDDIAAVLYEPLMHNAGCIEPAPEFLTALRDVTRRHEAVLIFDEVITGFRHALGGYQEVCGITPDLSTFGKGLGNGYPVSLIAGAHRLMKHFNPRPLGGDVLLGGTYNGHPLAMAASLAVLDRMSRPGAYEHLFDLGSRFRDGLKTIAQASDISMGVFGFGSISAIHFGAFGSGSVSGFDQLTENDTAMDVAFRQALLARGVACSTTPLRRYHFCLAHSFQDVDALLSTIAEILPELARTQEQTK